MKAALRALLFLFAATPAVAGSQLDTWVERELVPYVLETLTSHPRFKAERVRFVIFDGDDTAAAGSELALAVRDRLFNAAIQAGGIHIATQRSTPSTDRVALDCTRGDAHYAIGISLAPRTGGQWELTVRARDLIEAQLVPGFGRSWHGYLDTREHLAANRVREDKTLLGERGAPFESHQADLLAAQLAYQLACAVARQTRGRYVIAQNALPAGDDVFDGTLALIGNNVAAHPAFDLAATPDKANATLSGKAHRIDGTLYQYWLTLSPTGKADGLGAISASSYIRMPGSLDTSAGKRVAVRERTPHRAGTVDLPHAERPLLGTLRLRPAATTSRCPGTVLRGARYGSGNSGCSLLETTAATDAVVFLVAQRPSLGLVRIDDGACRRRVQPMLLPERQTLSVAVPWVPDDGARIRDVAAWPLEPSGEVYFAIAVADGALARRVANHVDRLPLRCDAGTHRGIRDAALRSWLAGLDGLFAEADGRLDWRAIELSQVY